MKKPARGGELVDTKIRTLGGLEHLFDWKGIKLKHLEFGVPRPPQKQHYLSGQPQRLRETKLFCMH